MPTTIVRSIYNASVNAYLAHFASMCILANEGLDEDQDDLFEVTCDGGPMLVSATAPSIDIRKLEEGKTVEMGEPAPPDAPITRFDPWTFTLKSKLLGIDCFAIVLHVDDRIETSLALAASPSRAEPLVLPMAFRPSLDDIEVVHELMGEICSAGIEAARGRQPASFAAELLMAIFAPRPESTIPAPPDEETLDAHRQSP